MNPLITDMADIRQQQRQRLLSGLQQMHLQSTEDEIERLLRLLALLSRWNKAYNLTAVRDELRMVPHHLLDSLALLPYLHGDRILDVGTGAGFPGLPLAIMQPERQFVLLDSNGKKIRFVRQAVLELGIKNVETAHSRIESYRGTEKFATILARAFASLPDIVRLIRPLSLADGILLAAKSRRAEEEIQALSLPSAEARLHPLHVPFLQAERAVVVMRLQ